MRNPVAPVVITEAQLFGREAKFQSRRLSQTRRSGRGPEHGAVRETT